MDLVGQRGDDVDGAATNGEFVGAVAFQGSNRTLQGQTCAGFQFVANSHRDYHDDQMGIDSVLEPVIVRSGLQVRLRRPKGLVDPQQLRIQRNHLPGLQIDPRGFVALEAYSR